MTQRGDIAKAVGISVAFHLMLGLWMLKTVLDVRVEPPVFTELTLGQLSPEALARILDREARQQARAIGETPTQRVKLPQRLMLEVEEPSISVPKQRKLSAATSADDEKPLPAPEPKIPAARQAELPQPEKKQTLPQRKIVVGTEPGRGVETMRVGAEARPQFKIEGDVQHREILESPLPEYPPGLQKEASIKIRFAVLPGGAVGSMHLVQKADTQLENLTLRYFKQWRFKPLDQRQEQKVQTGTITFVYRLE